MLREESMYQTFSLFFSDFKIFLLVEQTNLYAIKDKNIQTFNDANLRNIFGLLLKSGYPIFLQKQTTGAQPKIWKLLYFQKLWREIVYVL